MKTEVINIGSKALVAYKRAKDKAIAEGRLVYIGREIKDYHGHTLWEESKWHNPFKGEPNEVLVEKYRQYLLGNAGLLSQIRELKGKVLGCLKVKRRNPNER